MPGLPGFVSADRPPKNEIALVAPTPRFQHFIDVEVAAEPDKIIAPIEIVLPSTGTSLITGIDVISQLIGHICVVAAIDASVGDDGSGLRD